MSRADSSAARQSEETDVFTDKDGDVVTGKSLRLMDSAAYWLAFLPLTLLLAIATTDKRAATWSAFTANLALLMLDYFRTRYYKTIMRYPDVVPTFTLIGFLALGISVEIVPDISSLVLGPILVSLLLAGMVFSSVFHEAYPLHSSDCLLFRDIKQSAVYERVSRKMFAIWILVLLLTMIFIWCSTVFGPTSAGYIILGIVIPILAFTVLTLLTPRLARYFYDHERNQHDEEARRLI